jgi:hypothetical protein
MHVVMPALWIVFLELTRWRRLAKKRAEDKREGIPLARWTAAPLSSLRMHRRMILRNTRSYAVAVELEDARRFIAAITRAHFGKGWKREAPCILLDRIRSGRLGDDVTRAATLSVTAGVTGGWEEAARAMVTRAVTEGDKLSAAVKREQRQITAAESGTSSARKPARRPGQKRRTSRGTTQADKRAIVLSALADNPLRTDVDIAAEAGVSAKTVSRYRNSPLHSVG